jgi:hypothetical protein
MTRGKQHERFDKAKWWFILDDEDENKLFIERSNGRAMCKGERLNQVTDIQQSVKKTTTLKVK